MAMPLDVTWTHAFWADQPGFTAPANGAALPSAPDNIGSTGGTWSGSGYFNADWVTDFAGSGKPAIQTIGAGGGVTLSAADTTPTTIAVVGKALGNDSDLFDMVTVRRLVDRSSTSWRMYAGSTGGLPVSGPTADSNPHLFIATFDGASSYFYIDGVEYGPFDTGSNSGTDVLQIGHSTSGDGNVDGTEVAFVGMYNGTLTTQQKADLYTWYQADYLGTGAPAAPSISNISTTPTSVTLEWNAVAGVDGYRVWVDDVEDTAAGLITGTSYTKTGLTNGVEYTFKIRSEEGAQQSADTTVTERAALIYNSVDVDFYQGSGHTPLVTTPQAEDVPVLVWNEWSAFYENNRQEGVHFYWYLANTTDKAYCYASDWLDGATIGWRSGGAIRIIEWHRGDDAWRETDISSSNKTHTIDLSNTTTNAGAGSVTGPFDSVFIEYVTANDPAFSVHIWPNEEPGAQGLYVGGSLATTAYVGSTQVVRAYLGSTLVFGGAP